MAGSRDVTLLDAIQAVSEVAANDEETLATVIHLISSGQVRLSDDAIRAMINPLAPSDAAA
jgi:predicted nucleotidyltransferase